MPLRTLAAEHLSAGAGGAVDRLNFNSLVGLKLMEWRKGYARIELDLRDEHLNGVGSVHGGVLMTLLDTVMGFSGVFAEEGEESKGCATIAMNCKFLKPALAGRLFAEAQVQGGGKSIFFTRSEIKDESGDVVATGDGTFRYRNIPAKAASEP